MKKALFALSTLALASAGAFAQSSVKLYGIVDAAVRIETNQGADKSSVTSVIPGGLSESRMGLDITEDLGGGYRALANMEHRFRSDEGGQAATEFWRQAWVGLLTPMGRVTLGRQYNVLFDLTTGNHASYRYSPYIENFKPEIGNLLSGRQSNMLKYALTAGGLTAELQYSASEKGTVTLGEKTTGGMARYVMGGFSVGAGVLNSKTTSGKDAKATVLGASYTSGGLYLNVSRTKNKFDAAYELGSAYATAFFKGASLVNAATAKDRTMTSFGATYQITPQFNLGAQYYDVSQNHYGAPKTDYKLYSMVGDYALSKRTDWYVEYDRVSMSSTSTMIFANGARSRNGYMTGVRHRF
ncbi:porin [Inhella gelatinilytica]|uniref:Porin n=1 Tax=Inhella gelatinilytica TaxID=2795030 RepID=A0A931IWN5_9BURK|nr:porin [Inhella gelatinilytica]MBH9552419.1 porin [Inhella gelatinilytica]